MMNKKYVGFISILIFFGFLGGGCSNSQSSPKKIMQNSKKYNIETEAKKYGLTKEEYYNSYMKWYIEYGLNKEEYFKYVVNSDYNKKFDDYKKLGLTRYEYFGDTGGGTDLSKYGVYYSGDGTLMPIIIEVLVYKNKVNESIQEIQKLNNLVASVQMFTEKCTTSSVYGWYDTFLRQSEIGGIHNYVGLQKNVNLNNTVCLKVKSHPGLEPYTTLALRKLSTVLYAFRFGAAAGGSVEAIPVEDFKKSSEDYMKKENNLDNVKLTKNKDTSLKSNYINKN